MIPFGFEDNKIKVALEDPLNIFAIDDITISTGFEVESFIARKADIVKFIGIYYTSQEVDQAAMQLSKENSKITKTYVQENDLNETNNSPVVKMVDYLFKKCYRNESIGHTYRTF